MARTPDFTGPRGWAAWRSTVLPTPTATVAQYLLYCPGAHLGWSYWGAGIIHLRDIAGLNPAVITRPDATHEVIFWSINPQACPTPDPDAPTWPYLMPFDLVEQFTALGDESAVEVLRQMVALIMTGTMSPDQDFRTYWRGWLFAKERELGRRS